MNRDSMNGYGANSLPNNSEWKVVPQRRRRGKATREDLENPYNFQIGLDSRAAVSVLPRTACSEYELQANSGEPIYYRAASVDRMIGNGSRCVTVITDGQEFKHINFRVTGVRTALAPISAICDRNQKAVFDNDGGYILDKRSGKMTPFERDNDVYHLNVQVPKPQPRSGCKPLAPVDRSTNSSGAKAAKRLDFARLAPFLP